MDIKYMKLFLILFFIQITHLLIGNTKYTPLVYDNSAQITNIGKSVWILEDEQNQWSINEIYESDLFIKSESEVPNLNISTSSFWIRMDIKNSTPSNNLLLELDHAIIDEVEFYTLLSSGVFKVQKMGEQLNFYQRKYQHPNYIFDLYIDKGQTVTYFFKVKSSEHILLPIHVGRPQLIFESIFTKNLIFGIYCGIIIVIFFYNLFLFCIVRDISYLYYVGYVMLMGLTQAIVKGYSFQYLWPDSSWLAINSAYLVPSLVGITAIAFINSFLQLKQLNRLYYRILNVIKAIYLLCIVLGLAGLLVVSHQILLINVLIGSLIVLYLGIMLAKKGNRSAIYFLIAWSFLLICVCIYVLKNVGVFPHNVFTYYVLEIGSAVETILLSFALGDKINTYKKERLVAVQEKEELLTEQNVKLDKKVSKRTEELNNTLTELQSTQNQLVQSERLLLAAGIAHEVNNPLSYMQQNVEIIKEDLIDVKDLITQYEGINEDNVQQKIETIEKYKKEVKIEQVYSEIDRALEDIEDGIYRTETITKDLKAFSRLDETSYETASITENIDSTLQLMQHELAIKKIKVTKDYGQVSTIAFDSGKLNQVFLNLFINSIYAIEHRVDQTIQGQLTIKITRVGNELAIIVEDNGCGMSEETKKRLFDPFYTTKAASEGTGLGMSTAYGIIKNHQGNMQVASTLNKGSKISIHLPLS
jgi:signal transduction histidine kinase